jgi:hypothetical protein
LGLRNLGENQPRSVNRPPRKLRTATILILLAFVVEGGLIFWQISFPLRIHLVPARGSPAASVTTFPSALGSLPVSTQVDFTCTLPMTVNSRRLLVSLPSGAIRLNEPQPPGTSSPNNSSFIQKRWLPVPRAWVPPDGRSYASVVGAADGSGIDAIFLTSVNGTRRELWRGSGHPMLVGWSSGGLYFLLQSPSSASQGLPALWLVDPDNAGLAHRVGPNPLFAAAGAPLLPRFSSDTKLSGDKAWDVLQGADDNLDRVARMDLQTGSVSVWYTAPFGAKVFILGFDDHGQPILALSSSNTSSSRALMLLIGSGQTVPIAGEQAGSGGFANAFADTHGVWVGSSGAVWLYRGGSFHKVVAVPDTQVRTETPVPISGAAGTGSLPPAAVVGPCS